MTRPILIDGNNLAYRSYYAHKSLTWEGEITGTYHGFLNAVLRLKAQFGKELIFCWDSPNSWRKEVCEQYKAKRTTKDNAEDRKQVRKHIVKLQSVVSDLGHPSFEVTRLEADDLIGILSSRFPACYIHSSDRDFYQLLNESIEIIAPTPLGPYKRITTKIVKKEYGISPLQWADYLSMGGDKSDGIKALPGIGPVKALDLVTIGAKPRQKWSEQPEVVRHRYARCERSWPILTQIRGIVEIPRKILDLPLPERSQAKEISRLRLERFSPEKDAVKTFLAHYGLTELMVRRKELFE